MEIVLADTPDTPKTYTGDPRQWPDGVYVCEEINFYVFVFKDEWMILDKDKNWFASSEPSIPTCEYTRVPGYTGGIASITPERA